MNAEELIEKLLRKLEETPSVRLADVEVKLDVELAGKAETDVVDATLIHRTKEDGQTVNKYIFMIVG